MDKNLGDKGLGVVWKRVFALIKLITGDVDVSGKGNLQEQINGMEMSYEETMEILNN